jgi:lipid-A-disaccharide synthase
MISCGEASGDLYAASLVADLRAIDPTTTAVGFGGPRLRDAGADLVGDYKGMSVTGVLEAAPVLRRALRMRRALCDAARDHRPDVLVAIDFPDFNFRLLPPIHELGVPIVYYISPQLWAWRARRIETIKRYVDRMLVIFPFEVPIYEQAGVSVEFVGHPLVDLARSQRTRAQLLADVGFDATKPVLALLPGSRANEVRPLLPGLVAAVKLMTSRVPGIQVLIARAPALDDALFAPLDELENAGIRCAVVSGAADDVLAATDVVITASGTATVQSALHGRPMVVVYRLSALTSVLVKPFVRVSTYGMVNLVAGRRIVPELIQDDFTPARVAAETIPLFTDRQRVETMTRDLADVRTRLGAPGASMRAARAISDVMTARKGTHRSSTTRAAL